MWQLKSGFIAAIIILNRLKSLESTKTLEAKVTDYTWIFKMLTLYIIQKCRYIHLYFMTFTRKALSGKNGARCSDSVILNWKLYYVFTVDTQNQKLSKQPNVYAEFELNYKTNAILRNSLSSRALIKNYNTYNKTKQFLEFYINNYNFIKKKMLQIHFTPQT